MIVIYGINEKLNPLKTQLSDVIQACMTEVLGLPEGKRAHRFVPLPKEDMFYPEGRTDAYTFIEVNMMEGRKKNTKKRLIKTLFRQISTELNIHVNDIEIVIKEQPAYCWGFRGMTGDEVNDLSYEVAV